ncbi:MAG: hypothetical protein ABI747_02250 [Candidatus Moraniibacteriota bacterium]
MDTLTPLSNGSPKKPAFLIKWAFVIGIAILANLFAYSVVQALYPEPRYDLFCEPKQVNAAIENQDACLKLGGQWTENAQPMSVPEGKTLVIPQPAGYCDQNFTCAKEYQDATSLYNRNVFIVFVVFGLMLLMGGVFLSTSEAVSLGLSFGGVIALIIGSTRYWSDMQEWLRVIVLGIALAGLIYFAWKKFKNE